jgi:hypothetical protein
METRSTVLPHGGIGFGADTSSKVERHVSSRIDDGGSRRRGAAKSQWRTCAKVRAQGGGTVWRHGGIIVGSTKFIGILTLKMARQFASGDESCRCSLSVC